MVKIKIDALMKRDGSEMTKMFLNEVANLEREKGCKVETVYLYMHNDNKDYLNNLVKLPIELSSVLVDMVFNVLNEFDNDTYITLGADYGSCYSRDLVICNSKEVK